MSIMGNGLAKCASIRFSAICVFALRLGVCIFIGNATGNCLTLWPNAKRRTLFQMHNVNSIRNSMKFFSFCR